MEALLALARLIDRINNGFGVIAAVAALASCFISAGNALVRYGMDISSNAFLEIQWYLFAACVMLGAGQVLRLNEHVRVDLVYGRISARAKAWVDLLGILFFLLPVMLYCGWLSWDFFVDKFASGEVSSSAGGLIRWPAALMLPLGFALVSLQGVAELIKRAAWLAHRLEMDLGYERPLQ
ncbi:MAG: TRAP transporter small permease subunit [Paucibacter sp.]|nr:TRAP transporter small permease subunit [Roseateles sp.]